VSIGQLNIDVGGLDDAVFTALAAAFGMRGVAAAAWALDRVWGFRAFRRLVHLVRVAYVNTPMPTG
jgi:hypothetical protein